MDGGFACDKGKHNNGLSNIELDLKGIFDDEQLQELSEDAKKELYIALNKCYVCKLFGSNMVAGKLTFTDLMINDCIEVFYYTSTAIDRKKRIVREGSLFTVEYIIPNNLTMTIITDNIEREKEGRLLAALLEYILKIGIKVGGLKSRGYGLIKLDKNSTVKVIEFKEDIKNDDDVIYNISALILRNNYKTMTIGEYKNEL